jgi:hypothetical protein
VALHHQAARVVRRQKDRTELVAEKSFQLGWHRPHQVRVYLWANSDALGINSPGRGDESTTVSGRSGIAVGAWNSTEWKTQMRHVKTDIPKTIGELHYSVGHLTTQIIQHEIAHLQLHLLRLFDGLTVFGWMQDEEKVCYTIGELSEKVTEFLIAHGGSP